MVSSIGIISAMALVLSVLTAAFTLSGFLLLGHYGRPEQTAAGFHDVPHAIRSMFQVCVPWRKQPHHPSLAERSTAAQHASHILIDSFIRRVPSPIMRPHAAVLTTQVLTMEDWEVVLSAYVGLAGWQVLPFFLLIITLGGQVLLSLMAAVMVQAFEEDQVLPSPLHVLHVLCPVSSSVLPSPHVLCPLSSSVLP